MGDDGAWQIAGQNRRRRSRPRSVTQTPKPTRRERGVAASRRTPSNLDYSYNETKNRTSSLKNGEGHDLMATKKRVLEEVQKLEHLMTLLKSSLFWESLVRKLDIVLSTLNLGRSDPPTTSVGAITPPAARSSGNGINDLDVRPSKPLSSTFDQCVVAPGGTPNAASEVQELIATATGRAALRAEERLGRACPGNGRRLSELVCYGIGNFSENHNSRYQLALALCLRDLLFPTGTAAADDRRVVSTTTYMNGDFESDDACANEPGEHGDRYGVSSPQPISAESSATSQRVGATERTAGARRRPRLITTHGAPHYCHRMLVFDPVIMDLERAVLEKLGCGVMEVNEQGKRCCCAQTVEEPVSARVVGEGGNRCQPTLFFMPHCPMRLYSNLLWANWSSEALGSTIVLGNSLIAYMDRLVPADILQDPSNAIARAQGLIQELQLHPYPSADKARWKKDSDRLPYLEVAFNDLSFSYSGPDLRASEAGCEEFMTRPEEFVEESDGELITGRAGGSSHADRPNHLNVHVVGANV